MKMKKYVFFFFLAILVINFIASDNALSKEKSPKKTKQCNIEGLGIFKIGKTNISIINDLENELNTKVIVTSNSLELYKLTGMPNHIFQFIPKSESDYQFSICPDVKEYVISVYNIADMKIEKLKLKFYKDVLFSISCDSSKELEEALKLKYGEPDFSVRTESVSCLYKYTGNKVTYEDKYYTSSWENGNIKALNTFMVWHGDKCENMFTRFLNIDDYKTSEIVRKCEDKIRQQHKVTENQKRVEKLKDF